MKVLAILTGEMCFDGITNSVYNYYRAMERSDMEIGVVSARGTDRKMKANFEALGCKVYPLENRDGNTIRYMLDLIRIIRREHYDIVHAHGNSATLAFEMVAAAIAGCHVRIIHSRNSSCEHIKADKLLRPLMYATYTDGFACGQKAGEWLFKNRPFTIMKNGKDIDRFLFDKEKREEYREKLHTTENEILLGHVGLFHRQKNHDFLIDVFAEICKRKNNYKLVLMGEGDEKQRIQEKVKALGLAQRVIFLGQQTNVEDWLQAMDIMVFPSLFEGMPNVVLEWQICGLPALISSEITQECKITDGVKYLPLDKGAAYWADQILQTEIVDRDGKQEAIKKVFAEAGFDIRKNAEILRTKYEELYSRRS